MDVDTRVPVTVVTGYLGAGKTTLLNHLLRTAAGKRFAVIVNEFGDVGIDGALIESGDEELIELSSGCLCCVVRGDLIRTLRSLLRRDPGLDGVLIETTGVANPSPVIQTFFADQMLAAMARLDAVVTVVDAVSIADRLGDSPDAADQVALASVLVVNKTSEGDAARVEALLRALNPTAPLHWVDRGRIAPGMVLDTGSLDLEQVSADLMQMQDSVPGAGHHDHVAANGIDSIALTSPEPLDRSALEAWLEDLLLVHGAAILRIKGVLTVSGEPLPLVVQAVNMLCEYGSGHAWNEEPRTSRMVFIGRALHRMNLAEGFAACQARLPVPARGGLRSSNGASPAV